MATKKSNPAKKKQAAKKKTAAKKKSTKIQEKPIVQDELEVKESESTPSYQEDEIQPSMPPVYTSQSQQETGSNSLLRYVIIAALVLVGVVAYTMFSKKQEPYKPQVATTPSPAMSEPKETAKPDAKQEKAEGEKAEEKPKVEEPKASALPGYATDKLAENKSFQEAGQYCKSLGYKLPSAAELRKVSQFPDSLKNSEIWTADQTDATRALRFVINTKKALYTDKNTKLKVLCKN